MTVGAHGITRQSDKANELVPYGRSACSQTRSANRRAFSNPGDSAEPTGSLLQLDGGVYPFYDQREFPIRRLHRLPQAEREVFLSGPDRITVLNFRPRMGQNSGQLTADSERDRVLSN